ncbi:hypothetical protein BHF71_07460 [Vulcanibacillus modesticaldus]|uniref:HD/PDEase domain-containing protein n=2 Tax=Vulcanibacillus modesticaldus TaxID=337097 RepID=A0A1D2YVQ2_9BACI|nr:hypothetical protein BHF71_07460 [Vulcanibacillus modesticaldus]
MRNNGDNRFRLIKIFEGWKEHTSIRLIMYGLLGLFMYLLLIGQVIPKTYKLTEGQVSPVTLTSPITVVDEWQTNRLKDDAVKSVSDVYTTDYTIVNDQLLQLEKFFDVIINIIGQEELTPEDKFNQLKEAKALAFLTNDSIKLISNLDEDKVKNLKYITTSTLDIVMNNGVRLSDLNTVYLKVEELIQSNPFDNEESTRNLAYEITKYFIKPNVFYNSDQTFLLRQEARNSVEPVMIKKDELIVKEGQFIDKHTYEKLKAAGLLKDSSTVFPHFGLVLLVSLILLILYFSIERMKPILHQDNKSLLMVFTIIIFTFISISIIGLFEESVLSSSYGFLAPVAFGVMLITLFISVKFAILSGLIFSIYASLVFSTDQTMIFDFRYGFVLLIGSTAGAFAVGNIRQRSSIFKSGLIVALFNVLSILVLIMLSAQSYTFREGIDSLVAGLIGGIFSAILTIGTMPFFETVFGILSPIKLVELSNPNHPLLRKLLIETPGTYHHSIIVGNLAESAAEAIGANGLLARVGAYYHDLGKTKRPTFFIENQLNSMENPHDKISPSLSKNIILAHPSDGVKMLKEHKIPVPIQDIAIQHHGTTLLKYFYHKAVKESEQIISEDEYRYPYPKPQTKEAAIVGIADSVEAAVRSISNPTNEIIEDTVRKIIKAKLDDGQLNECDLTLKELEIISVSMLETLKGIFHSRIEYPEDKEYQDKGAETS